MRSLVPLVACAALLIASTSAGGYSSTATKSSTGLADKGDSYLDAVDSAKTNNYNFEYVDNSDTSERDTLGDTVVAGKATDATASPNVVTLSPELKQESGLSDMESSSDGDTMATKGSPPEALSPETEAPSVETKATDAPASLDMIATKGSPPEVLSPETEAPSVETKATDAPESSDTPQATSQTTDSNSEWTPAPQSTDAPESTGESGSSDTPESTDDSGSSDTPQATPQAAKGDSQWTPSPQSTQANNQWTQAPTQSNNQWTEAPQPTQPSQNTSPQPTQPPQNGDPNNYWNGNWDSNQQGSSNNGQKSDSQGNWDSTSQTQSTLSPTTSSNSSDESNQDSPSPEEITYTSAPVVTPAAAPVSNCKVRRSRH